MSLHLVRVHKGVTEWKCTHCGSICKSHENLHSHIGNFHIYGRYECGFKDCGYDAVTRNVVLNHYRQVHERKSQPRQKVILTPKKMALLEKLNIDKNLVSPSRIGQKRPLEQ